MCAPVFLQSGASVLISSVPKAYCRPLRRFTLFTSLFKKKNGGCFFSFLFSCSLSLLFLSLILLFQNVFILFVSFWLIPPSLLPSFLSFSFILVFLYIPIYCFFPLPSFFFCFLPSFHCSCSFPSVLFSFFVYPLVNAIITSFIYLQ